MLWRDDNQLFDEVYNSLPKKQRVSLGSEWVRAAIERCPNQDWANAEVREGNMGDIKAEARAHNKSKGLEVKRRDSANRDYEPGAAQSYATMILMQGHVEAIRLKYWGTTEVPFRPTPEGRDKAAAWFYAQEKQDTAAHPEGLPGEAKVTFKLSAKNAAVANESEERLWEKYADAEGSRPWSEMMVLEQAKNIVSLVESGKAVFTHYGTSTFMRERIFLHFITSENEQRPVWALEGRTLGDLLKDVRELAGTSGWWPENNTLSALLFGLVVSAEIQRSNRFKLNKGVAYREITLRVVAPATPEDVAQAYADELGYLELNPKPFTKVQRWLFQLMYEYPKATWAERYEVWQRLQKNHPELTSYKDWRALRSSCNSALQRAENGWGAKSGPDKVIKTPTLQRPRQ